MTSFTVKRDLIAGLGVGELVVIPFDRAFASRDAREFIDSMLIERLSAGQVSVGRELPLRQRRGGGGPELLRSHGVRDPRGAPRRGVGRQCPPAISAALSPPARSTRRPASSAGRSCSTSEVGGQRSAASRQARRADGQPRARRRPRLQARRRRLGLRPSGGRERGHRPDLRHRSALPMLIEAHLIDFDGDLYGQTLRIAFIERLRGERQLRDGRRADRTDAPRHRAGEESVGERATRSGSPPPAGAPGRLLAGVFAPQ